MNPRSQIHSFLLLRKKRSGRRRKITMEIKVGEEVIIIPVCSYLFVPYWGKKEKRDCQTVQPFPPPKK